MERKREGLCVFSVFFFIMAMIDEWQRVGLMVTAFGLFFLFFGVMMMFDRALLAFGNLLFVTGVALVIGMQKTMAFFFQARKIKGTTCFFTGIVIVLWGWTIIGMIIEVFGFINLFGCVCLAYVLSHSNPSIVTSFQ